MCLLARNTVAEEFSQPEELHAHGGDTAGQAISDDLHLKPFAVTQFEDGLRLKLEWGEALGEEPGEGFGGAGVIGHCMVEALDDEVLQIILFVGDAAPSLGVFRPQERAGDGDEPGMKVCFRAVFVDAVIRLQKCQMSFSSASTPGGHAAAIVVRSCRWKAATIVR